MSFIALVYFSGGKLFSARTTRVARAATNSRIISGLKETVTEKPLERPVYWLPEGPVTDDVAPPLLTLFTTLKDLPGRRRLHNQTFMNWASMKPVVNPVFFAVSQDTRCAQLALHFGWTVMKIPNHRQGMPVFRAMFEHVSAVFKTPFYGYSNADILFNWGLVETVESLGEVGFTEGGELLGVGQRRNIAASKISETGPRAAKLLAETYTGVSSRHSSTAMDYFILTKAGLRWSEVPDLVVGRPGIDRWLFAHALMWNISVVDFSKSVMALHQTGDSHALSWNDKDDNKYANHDIVGPFQYPSADSVCAPWMSVRDIAGGVHIVKREETRPKKCKRPPPVGTRMVTSQNTTTPTAAIPQLKTNSSYATKKKKRSDGYLLVQ